MIRFCAVCEDFAQAAEEHRPQGGAEQSVRDRHSSSGKQYSDRQPGDADSG